MREKQIPCVDQMSFLSDTMFRETLAKNWTWQSVLGRGRGGGQLHFCRPLLTLQTYVTLTCPQLSGLENSLCLSQPEMHSMLPFRANGNFLSWSSKTLIYPNMFLLHETNFSLRVNSSHCKQISGSVSARVILTLVLPKMRLTTTKLST